MTAIDASPSIVGRVLTRLEGVVERGEHQWASRCPAHEDRDPSLSISIGHNGGVLLCCHAGCPTDEILRAVGLESATCSRT